MVKVALAGSSTGIGHTLLQTFLHLNTQLLAPEDRHSFVLISRTPQPHLPLPVRTVTYADHAELVAALSDVHTVICTHGGNGPGGIRDAQLALIRAAREAGVQRFAPSEFAGKGYEGLALYGAKAVVWEALCASGIPEYTRFNCGLFMSVFATGTEKGMSEVGVREGRRSGEDEALAGLRPWNFVVNMRAGTADLAEKGEAELVFTEIRDVARYVFLALGLDKWEEKDMGIRGEVSSFRKAVEVAERVQGRKFLTKENSVEQMSAMAKEKDKEFYWQVQMKLNEGWGLVGDELNRKFPEYKPVGIEEFVGKWWSGTKLNEPAWADSTVFSADKM